ncbi:hypothetical protein MSAR_39610 [Mycolicibacterium sarraceniae]|uniref:Short-chain dehydrogenase n=1 Tax=Mycolicibacterium sarraceniae TaxID=1534348 RepID=A0A7I7SXU0_9MYCO|nr:hypothetical protein MSAR_39610 [Mycolicibacterium sarraceniae]
MTHRAVHLLATEQRELARLFGGETGDQVKTFSHCRWEDDPEGTGVAIQVDHLDAAQVRGLADRSRADYGRIDVLVNDIWGAEILKGPPPEWNRPIWEHDIDSGSI